LLSGRVGVICAVNPKSRIGRRRFLGTGQRLHASISCVLKSESANVAKTGPLEFINQVRAETAKVVWPSRRETIMTGIMVMIMTTMLAVFFFGIDTIFEAIVKFLLTLAN
jgi:preprotein translocase subunit SecE